MFSEMIWLRLAREASGLPLIDGYPAIRAWLDDRGIADYAGSPLTVSAKDSHPSAVQHALIAGTLTDVVLGELGLVSARRSSKVSGLHEGEIP